MKDQLTIFTSPTLGDVRTKGTSDQPLFCLADVCRVLGIINPSDLKKRLKRDGVVSSEGVSLTTNQYGKTTVQKTNLTFINEPNLYRCIFQSRKKEAELFQDWIFEEVIPAIRAKGQYSLADKQKLERQLEESSKLIDTYHSQMEDAIAKLNKASEITRKQKEEIAEWKQKYQLADLGREAVLKRSDVEVKTLEKQFKERAKTYAEKMAEMEEQLERYEYILEHQAPPRNLSPEAYDLAVYGKACRASGQSCTIATLAKMLRSNGIDTGFKRLSKWLRDMGYICKTGADRGFPVQKVIEKGWFEVKMVETEDHRGQKIMELTPLVTALGQSHITTKLMGGLA